MFIHSVLFEIEPKNVAGYYKDNRMWASCARKCKGFVAFYAMKLQDRKNQYASVYKWKTIADYKRFMRCCHDLLAEKSGAKVKFMGYFNMKVISKVK